MTKYYLTHATLMSDGSRGPAKLSTLERQSAPQLAEFSVRHLSHLVWHSIFEINHYFSSGAVHEILRFDRDTFVQVITKNIEPGAAKAFEKMAESHFTTSNTSFDLSSIMMPGPTNYGITDVAGRRMATLKSLAPGVKLKWEMVLNLYKQEFRDVGEKKELSLIDKIGLGRLYQQVTGMMSLSPKLSFFLRKEMLQRCRSFWVWAVGKVEKAVAVGAWQGGSVTSLSLPPQIVQSTICWNH